MKAFQSAAIVFALATALWPAGPAAQAATTLLLVQATAGVSAEEAAALVRAASGGRILSVRSDETADPPVYYVKVLLDGGRVRVYLVDGNSGRITP